MTARTRVARDRAGDEDDVALEPGDAVAAVGERVDRQVELGARLGAGDVEAPCADQDRRR